MLATNLNRNAPRLLLIAATAGFVFLLIELITLGHINFAKLYGAIAAGVGAVLGLAALFVGGGVRRIVGILFLVLSLSGLYGFVIHSGARGSRNEGVAKVAQQEDRTIGRALRSFGLLPPVLSPLMLTGLALLGAAGAMAATVELGAAEGVVRRTASA
jgi:hypothetical protein